MRCALRLIIASVILGLAPPTWAETVTSDPKASAPKQMEVTADQSLEWYQDQQIYVARVNAKAVRGDMVVEADTLTAHERDKPKTPPGAAGTKVAVVKTKQNENGTGDIDVMTADGHVRITDPRQRVTGDHAVYDIDKHVIVVTGQHLKYESEKEVVTARDSMEYWEEKKVAVARGHAIGDQGERHVEGDVLTTEFRDEPNGSTSMWKMTADGNVTIITKGDVSRGNSAVYDVSRNIAIINGNVRITRADGTQLTGDVGEVDFATNQSRLLNDGTHRVRALLTSRTTSKDKTSATSTPLSHSATASP